MAVLALLPIMLVMCFGLALLQVIGSKYSFVTESEGMLLLITEILFWVCHVTSAIVFIFHVIRFDKFNRRKKIIWTCLLLLFATIVCPAYFSEYIYQKKSHFTEKELEIQKKRLRIWALLPGFVVLFIASTFFYGADAMRIHASDAELILGACIFGIFILPLFHLISAVRYIILINENKDMNNGKKLLWGILFLLFSGVTCPIYWFDYVNKKKILGE